MPEVPVFYWDACVVISYLDGDPDRAPDIEAFLQRAEKGEIRLVSSTISITEVAFVAQEKLARELKPEEEQRIDEFWRGPIELVEFHPMLAADARTLIRRSMVDHGPTLKPLDAVHLATAIRMGATTIHTYDGPLKTAAKAAGLDAHAPMADQIPLLLPAADAEELRVEEPEQPAGAEGVEDSSRPAAEAERVRAPSERSPESEMTSSPPRKGDGVTNEEADKASDGPVDSVERPRHQSEGVTSEEPDRPLPPLPSQG